MALYYLIFYFSWISEVVKLGYLLILRRKRIHHAYIIDQYKLSIYTKKYSQLIRSKKLYT